MHRLLAIASLFVATAVAAAPVKGHPMLKPYEGSSLNPNETAAFDYEEAHIPVKKRPDANPESGDVVVAGKVTALAYDNPSGRSAIEIARNYEDALKKGGFKVLYECKAEACGNPKNLRWLGRYGYGLGDQNYFSAKLERPAEGDVFAAVNISSGEQHIIIVEAKPMETGLVKIDANAMLRELQSTGHVAVYGILFDTDKATLKGESKEALDEVRKLMGLDPSLNLYVVGHTDDVGSFDHNLDLSRRRAQAVVKELTGTYKVPAARLKADGVGPLVPVASNLNDAGKARNRRVELVQKIGK